MSIEHSPGRSRRLISDRQVRLKFGDISSVTLWRWTNDLDLKFPQPVQINGRNFRDDDECDKFIDHLRDVNPEVDEE